MRIIPLLINGQLPKSYIYLILFSNYNINDDNISKFAPKKNTGEWID